MKTKNMIGLASGLIFGAAILLGITVAVILYLGSLRNNEAEASLVNTSEDASPNTNEFVLLYNNTDHQIMRVNINDGSSQGFDLGLPANSYINGRAVSSDGRLLAFCSMEENNGVYETGRFIVRDLVAGSNLVEHDFGRLPGCNPSAFSPDNSRVAVGFVFNSLITNEVDFPDEPNWALRIFDVNTGEVVQEISAESPNAPDFESMTEFWFEPNISPMADVISYGENSLYFLAFPFVGRDGPPASPAYRWDFADNSLTQIEGLGNNGATFLERTGEIAYPFLNEDYPAAQPMGPVALANEIRLTDASGTRTVYRDTENIIAQVSFVNGGRQLAVYLIPAYNPDNPDEVPISRHILLNRDGSVENMNSASMSYAQLFATSDGFGVLKIDQVQKPTQEYVNQHQLLGYANGELFLIWEYEGVMTERGQVWMELIWATPQQIAPNLPPFTGIN